MFYAHFVLAKKGPLARIWLAAHWDKKLTKAHVFETNIESSVEGILQPKVKMALRTSGHLLLGIVRIFSRKAKYLLADCNEAFIKIKMAFRPGVVDLPEAAREAAVATITLPEVFHDFDSAMPDITIDIDEQVTLNQSRAEDITLKEDYGNLTLMADDGFDDMAFDEPEAARDATSMEEGFESASLLLGEQCSKEGAEETTQINNTSVATSKPNVSLSTSLTDDGFGGTVGEGLLDGETGGLFEPAGLFDDAPLDNVALENPEQTANTTTTTTTAAEATATTTTITTEEPTVATTPAPVEKPPEQTPVPEEDSDDDMYDAPASMGAPSPPTSPESEPVEKPPEPDVDALLPSNSQTENTTLLDINPPERPPLEPPDAPANIMPPVPETPQMPPPALDHTTLINNEDESFALAPLDTTIMQGAERTVKAKRKRKLIVDEVKNISGEEMKSQLSDTTDIVTTLDLAPPTKRLMHWKETGGVEKLFALPGYQILSSRLSRAYQRHLTTRSVDNEDFGTEDDLHIDLDVDVEQPRERDEPEMNNSISRKRPRRGDVNPMYPQDLSHLDTTLQLDASRQSYASDHNMTHPSLDVPNFIQQQIMGNVMQQHPPPHMMQQMLQTNVPDVNQLAHHLPDMMHHPSMVDQGPQLHPMASNMHNVPNVPSPSDAFNRLVQSSMGQEHRHLLSDAIPDQMQQNSLDRQLSNHQMNQQLLQDHLSQSNAITNIIENNLHPNGEGSEMMQSHMDGHVVPPPVDEEVTQPLLSEEYAHAIQPLDNTLPTTISNMLPNNDEMHNNSHVVNDHSRNETLNSQDTTLALEPQPELNQTVEQDHQPDLFDTINNGNAFGLMQNNSTNNDTTTPANQLAQNDNTAAQNDNAAAQNDNAATQNDNAAAQNDNTVAQNDAAAQQNLPLSEDDDDDYAAPPSVGPALPEEQMADETYEQFEERILTKRTTHMLHIINSRIDHDRRNVNFADIVRNNKRKQVAQKFYTFLVLKKQQAIELEQTSSYGMVE